MNTPCVYSITNLLNGKRYIGSTKNFGKREYSHIYHLNRGTHDNHHLQKAWNKYGQSHFIFWIMSVVQKVEDLLAVEQSWIEGFLPDYNICLDASGGRRGMKTSKETRAKYAALASDRFKGVPKSESHKAKIRLSHIGMRPTSETREKIRQSKLGLRASEETKSKMSIAHSGPRCHWFGRPKTDAEKNAISKRNSGIIPSIATREKMSASQKLRWAN